MNKHPFEIKTSGGNYFQTLPKKMNYRAYMKALKVKFNEINGGNKNAENCKETVADTTGTEST